MTHVAQLGRLRYALQFRGGMKDFWITGIDAGPNKGR
jgi:hypothetical protein